MRLRIGFLVAGLLAACGAVGTSDVPTEFGKAARSIGIFPVYPPREEFQIGDVYAWSQSVSDPNDTLSVYIDTIDWMQREADIFMQSRIIFTDTTVANSEISNTQDIPGTYSPGSGKTVSGPYPYLQNRRLQPELAASLPIAAFPSISADAGFSASTGLVGLLEAFGLIGGARTTVTLNFNDVRTYWVPSPQVMGRALQDAARIMGQYGQAAQIERRRLVQARRGASADPCENGRRCGITIITRVYLTRKIEYTYRNSRIIAAAFDQVSADETESDVSNAPSAGNVVVNVGTGAAGSATVSDAQIQALQSQLDTLTNSHPGSSFKFSGWDARGASFNQTYMRPVAIGWDGIDLSNVSVVQR